MPGLETLSREAAAVCHRVTPRVPAIVIQIGERESESRADVFHRAAAVTVQQHAVVRLPYRERRFPVVVRRTARTPTVVTGTTNGRKPHQDSFRLHDDRSRLEMVRSASHVSRSARLTRTFAPSR